MKLPGRSKTVIPALLLAALACAAFATTVRNDFISLDDKLEICQNPEALRIAPDHARARSLLLTARSAGDSRGRVGDAPLHPAPHAR